MKKPIAIISTDWHQDSDNTEILDDLQRQEIELAKKLGIDTSIKLGDDFESRRSQPLSNLTAFTNRLSVYSDNEIKCVSIPGNHDKVNLELNDSYLSLFKHHPNFNLIEYYTHSPTSKIHLHFIPYFKEDGRYGEELQKCIKNVKKLKQESDKIHILLTHIAVSGVKNNDSSEVENDLKISSFKEFDSVLVGHYHNKSKVGKNIHYIGSIRPKNFGEDNDKGVLVLYDDGSFEEVNFDFPQYEKITINIDKVSNKEIDALLQEHQDSDDNIRFEFTGDSAKLKSLDTVKFTSKGIDVTKKVKEIEDVIDLSYHNEVIEYDKESILIEFDDFCVIKEIEDNKYGLKILEEAL